MNELERMYDRTNVSIEEAQELIMRLCKENFAERMQDGGVENIRLQDAQGRILAEDVHSPVMQPPFDRSPLDGYALRAEDSRGAQEREVVLQVVGEVDAGQFLDTTLQKGQAVRIMTGAPIPKGADCVIRQEDTDCGERCVRIMKTLQPHQNYCDAGEDYRIGDCLIRRGTKISEIEIGILAGMGMSEVSVVRKPRIAVFTTGDELVSASECRGLPPGKIYNSNLLMAVAKLNKAGGEVILFDHVSDDAGIVAKRLEEARLAGAELIVTTGGVSVGKKDIMHEALCRAGARGIFWRVQVKPGTPAIFSMLGNLPVLSLSGNPFGVVVHLDLLVRPALAAITGAESFLPKRGKAVLSHPFLKEGQTVRMVRAREESGIVTPGTGVHSSGVLSSMQGCNCLMRVPALTQVRAGDKVEILWIDR